MNVTKTKRKIFFWMRRTAGHLSCKYDVWNASLPINDLHCSSNIAYKHNFRAFEDDDLSDKELLLNVSNLEADDKPSATLECE